MKSDKYKDAMRSLRRYESKDQIKNDYLLRYGVGSISATKTTSVVMNIKQGRELFESASRSDYMTRPIELYYGMSSYSRAMELIFNRSMSESSLEQAHGIKITNMPVNALDINAILNLEIEFERGGFTQWYRTTQDSFILRTNSSIATWVIGFDEDELAGKKIKFHELVKLFPDLSSEIHLLMDYDFPSLAVSSYSDMIIGFDGLASLENVKRCFPGLDESNITSINNTNWRVDFTSLGDFAPQFVQQNEDGFSIGTVLIVPPVNGLRLSPLATYMALAYVLSMLARYRPSIWGGIWTGGNANRLYPLLSEFMDLANEWYPYVLSENLSMPRS